MKFNAIIKFTPCFYILLSVISIFLFFASFIDISILGISENVSGFELIFNYGNGKGEHGSYSVYAFFILIILSFTQYIIYACSFKETKDSLFFNIRLYSVYGRGWPGSVLVSFGCRDYWRSGDVIDRRFCFIAGSGIEKRCFATKN